MLCEKCGVELREDSKFCFNCGSPVNVQPKSEPIPVPADVPNTEDQVNESSEIKSAEAEVDNVAEDIVEHEDVTDKQIDDAELPISEDPVADAETVDNINESEETVQAGQMEDDEAVQAFEQKDDQEPEKENGSEPEVKEEVNSDAEQTVEETVKPQVKDKHNKKLPKRSIGSRIGAGFLCFFLAIFLILTVAIAAVHLIINPAAIEDMISDIKIDELKIEDYTSREELEDLGWICDSDSETIIELIYDNIDQSLLHGEITKKEFKEIITDNSFYDYISEMLSDNIENIIEGDSRKKVIISLDDINEFIDDEQDEIEDIIGRELSDSEIANIKHAIGTSFNNVFETIELDDYIGDVGITIVEIVFSDWLLIVLLVIDALLCVLIFIVLRSIRGGFGYCGITAVIVGFIYLIPIIVMFIIAEGLIPLKGGLLDMVVGIINSALMNILVLCCIIVAVAIVMIVLSIILRVMAKKKLNKTA